MARPLPDRYGPARADLVEHAAVQRAVPQLVVAPGQQPFPGAVAAFGAGQSPPVLVLRMWSRAQTAGQHPVLGGDDVGDQGRRAEHRVQVLVDEAFADHGILEGLVDDAVPQVIEFAHGHDAVPGDQHSGGPAWCSVPSR